MDNSQENTEKKLPPFSPSSEWISKALEIPVEIKSEKFKKLVEHIKYTFHAFKENGEIDVNLLMRNLSYYMGHIYTNYNLLVLQEESKLAEYESEFKTIRATTLNTLKSQKLKYEVDQKGLVMLMEGNPEYNKAELRIKKQKAMVDFMRRTLDQIGYYGNNSRIIIDKLKHEQQYGLL